MKTIIVPPPVTILNLITDEPMMINGSSDPWPMWKYLAMYVLTDPAMGKGFEANHARVQILRAFKGTVVGEVVLDDDWVKGLQVAVANPAADIPVWAAIQCMPFQQAVMEAG